MAYFRLVNCKDAECVLEDFISAGLKAASGQYELFTDKIIWTIGNEDPLHEVCIPQDTSRMGSARVKQEEEI